VAVDELKATIQAIFPTFGTQVIITQSTSPALVTTGSGVLPADIVAIGTEVWNRALSGHQVSGSAGRITVDTLRALVNRMRIDVTAKTLTLFADDKITPIFVLDLKDATGAASTDQIFEREPQ